jgi:hypothetical protein
VVFVTGVTRTATRAARAGVDMATGEVLPASVLVERVGWLAELMAGLGRRVVDAHWNADDIRALRARETPSGTRMPSFAYKAVVSLWGW